MLYRTSCTHFDSWCLKPILIRKLISQWIHMNKVTVLDRLQFYYNASKTQHTLRGLPLFEPILFYFSSGQYDLSYYTS